MFVATHSFPLFDYLRVPYATRASEPVHDRIGELWRDSDTRPRPPRLVWVRTDVHQSGDTHRGVFQVGGARVAGVVQRDQPHHLLDEPGVTWTERLPVADEDGRRLCAVMTSTRGDVFLPFDPGAVMTGLWSEAYLELGSGARVRAAARRSAVRGYYAVRPMVPRRAQLALRRRLAGRTPVTAFPRWPVESGLHDLFELLLSLCGEVAGGPVPWIAPWPDGAGWCLVLTHDVETERGCTAVELLRAPERERGYRSAWNFVPERYPSPSHTIEALQDEDCEVGVHGVRHDGRDLAGRRLLLQRLPRMRAAAQKWGATGFRSPATQRRWDLMPLLGFDHDSSYTDSDPYEPQPGGCCTWWPYEIRDLVELPITLPQDHTLFSILGQRDGSAWVAKARELRRRGGMALVLSHPDYAQGAALSAWTELLDEFHDDSTAWKALPREVSAWWRERAASRPVLVDGAWTVDGPAAARARVLTSPRSRQTSRA